MSQHIYTYDPVNGLEEIGGAGHIIKDANGTAFSKRENLQFEGASVADDSTNNATVVTITETNFVGTYAQWNALTSAQKAQYKTVDLIDDFGGSPIDSSLSTTSENPVQNKVITVPLNKTYKDDDTTEATLADGDYFPFYDVSASAKRKTLWSNIVSKIKTALSIQNVLTSTDSAKPLSANMGNALGKMVAPIESSSTASRAYSIGSQFVYNGILYKATAAISSGGNINPGGNCTAAPSVTAQISDLSTDLSSVIMRKKISVSNATDQQVGNFYVGSINFANAVPNGYTAITVAYFYNGGTFAVGSLDTPTRVMYISNATMNKTTGYLEVAFVKNGYLSIVQ